MAGSTIDPDKLIYQEKKATLVYINIRGPFSPKWVKYDPHCLKLLKAATLLKKKLWQRCFPVNFAKFLKTLF